MLALGVNRNGASQPPAVLRLPITKILVLVLFTLPLLLLIGSLLLAKVYCILAR